MTKANNETRSATKRRKSPQHLEVPDLGCGAGLRIPHYRHVLDHRPDMGFFEVISENFFGLGGKPLYHLDRFKELFPIILHGVSLSIGAPEEPDPVYLQKLKKLVQRVKPAWVSDHFCFSGAGGAHMHDLLPLPYTEEAVERVARRARMIQDYLEVPFGLENTSSYLTYTRSTMSEWEFIREVVEEADCGLMFDVNNVYVSAYNHGFDPLTFVREIPHERILQIHIAGHTNYGDYIIDTHVGPLIDPVLDLYRETIRLAGSVSTLLEWDDQIPEFSELSSEVERVARVRAEGLRMDCAPLNRDVVLRAGVQETPPAAWSQGGPQASLATWEESPDADTLPAELRAP
jgi:uncharacterized protein (UPF0276 family)